MKRIYRDEELGVALRELEAPEHRTGFHALLQHRLAQEARARAAARRRARVRWAVRGSTVAVVAAAAAVGLPRLADGPEAATAAEVKAQVRTALAGMRNLGGVLVADGRRWRFTLSSEGDVRLEGPGKGEASTYDASGDVVRSAQRSASLGGGPLFYAERRGVAPGPPDEQSLLLLRSLGGYVRALLAARDPRVREVEYEGRPAWRVDVETVPNAIVPGLSGDSLEITVDSQTDLPVRVLERKSGAILRAVGIEGLVVNADLPPGTFRLTFPSRAEVMRSDDGFRRGKLGDAPFAPRWVPNGYDLAEIAVNRRSGVVSLSYRRGLDQFLVTTRPGDTDPFATAGFPDEPEPVRLRSGLEAKLVLNPRAIPHLWARADTLVVTVGGDLSRAELVRVADSLA